jgi:hypothetical protein
MPLLVGAHERPPVRESATKTSPAEPQEKAAMSSAPSPSKSPTTGSDRRSRNPSCHFWPTPSNERRLERDVDVAVPAALEADDVVSAVAVDIADGRSIAVAEPVATSDPYP